MARGGQDLIRVDRDVSRATRTSNTAGTIARNRHCCNRHCCNSSCCNRSCCNRSCCNRSCPVGSFLIVATERSQLAEDEDEFLDALSTLEDVLADNGQRASLIKKRIAQLRRSRSKGASYTELVSGDDRLIVQLLTESSKALDTSGANVRRAEAHALHAEGMTMEQIADRFGVTRQRVSTLLRKARE